ncbi:MAG: 6-bladed beta-propeller [Oryzomonas sp.]|uniref:6-bladed beta-propeller n=1 Tax=Oryzomonas sp. TaxID=2855186 RepID=UPI0028469D99|nr:6-bladed beta-propeller [Oryzomonas sp.]MDR3578335.1 6-bladed beta-propeller [Oryzomonas sp.]
MNRRLGIFFFIVMPAVLLPAGCATQAPYQTSRPIARLQWPLFSSRPQVIWQKNIATYQDAGIAKGFWKKALELLTGSEENRISKPYGVLSDDRGRLFIADPGAGCVHFMDIRSGRYTIIGDGDVRLRTPVGLAEDEQGNLYITDSTAAVVYVYRIGEKTLAPFLKKLVRPTGIVYNSFNKLLYVVDTVAGTVNVVDGEGKLQRSFGSPGEGRMNFNHPTDIAADRRGQLYVTDPLNYRVMIYSPEGQVVGQIGKAGDVPGELNKPKGVAIDSDGHIYVCDSLQDTVQMFDNNGALVLNFGSNGGDDGEFWMPSGIFIDAHDYIYVADTYNRRIQVFRYISKTRREGLEEP